MQTMNKYTVICEDCETVFQGGLDAHFCPKCLKKRLSENAKRRNLNRLGNEAYSKQQAERSVRNAKL